MDYRKLAKLFTSSTINKVAKGDFINIYSAIANYPMLKDCETIQEVYDESYKLLCKYYPNEYVLKNTIANKILLGRYSMKTASMLSELRVGSNKADCVIINGVSTCYEIKTKYDSLKRLSDQLSTYSKAFDHTYVVIHDSHLDEIMSMYLENPIFGVIVFTERNSLSEKIVAPKSEFFNSEIMFHTLRKEEYTDIIREITGKELSCSSVELFEKCKDVFCSLKQEEANKEFKRVLKEYRRNDHLFVGRLPKSMKNLGISFKISERNKSIIAASLVNCDTLKKEKMNVLPVYERKAI